MQIGILEDDRPLGRMLQLNLEYSGYTVKVSQTVKDFLATLGYDLIIVDLRLQSEQGEKGSGLSGADVIRYIRTISPEMPAILISAAPMTTLEAAARGLPGVKILQKVFKVKTLIETIRALTQFEAGTQ